MRHSLCAAFAAGPASSWIGGLHRLAAATPQAGDYKALVCVFLFGGNDGDNTLVPRGNAEYGAYAATRGPLAIPQGKLLAVSPGTSDGRQYGFHPGLPELQTLFAQKKLAVLANVGALVAPLTKAEYLSDKSPKPPQLFAHNEQVTHWMTAWPDAPPRTGWGGRLADIVNTLNSNAQLSMSVSLFGSNVFQVGHQVTPYQVSPEGVFSLSGHQTGANADPVSVAVRQLQQAEYANLFERAYRDVKQRAMDSAQLLSAALAQAPAVKTVFPGTKLGKQLSMVARLIAARGVLGLRRQIFFCAAEGYDTHGDQLTPHASLLTELSQSLSAFYYATVELGVASSVTTFTGSDFGRTYVQNGKGTDHGWGNIQFILGGAVKGGDIYGKVPVQQVNGPDDAGRGSWIPTTSVDEYSSTLALWFGVAPGALPSVFPNIGRFAKPNLGFLG